MRIAWISYDFPEYCRVQVTALARLKHEVMLIQANGETAATECEKVPGLQVVMREKPRLRQVVRQVKLVIECWKWIVAFRPDIVHFQHGHFWFNLSLVAFGRFPLVVTVHDPQHHQGDKESRKTPQCIMDLAARRADLVIVHGRYSAERVGRMAGVSRGRIRVIPHVAIGGGETVNDGRKAEVSREPEVLFFGRIWEYKGLEYLIKAAPLVAETVPRVKFVIAGRGENMDRYLDMIESPERFEVLNRWITDQERSELFQRAWVVALPYVAASQSGVIPVAFSHGKPVVVTDVGALPEYVEDGVTGLVVPPKDHRALASAIKRLLSDAKLRERMGRMGRARVAHDWSPEEIGQRTLKAYDCAVNAWSERCRKRPARPSGCADVQK